MAVPRPPQLAQLDGAVPETQGRERDDRLPDRLVWYRRILVLAVEHAEGQHRMLKHVDLELE